MFRKANRARAVRFVIPQLFLLLAFSSQVWAQPVPLGDLAIPGKTVDMVGPTLPGTGRAGNVLMQQNEVSGGTSILRPNVMVGAFNDYRLVYHPQGGDAVIGVATSKDYGKTWNSFAHPDFSIDGSQFPPGGADAVVAVLPGLFMIHHMAFWRDDSQPAQLRTSLWYEHNRDAGPEVTYLGSWVNNVSTAGQLRDKPSFKVMLWDPADGRPDIEIPIPAFTGPPNSGTSHDAYTLKVPAARVHKCFTKFVGNAAGTKVECQFSDDAARTFSHPVKLSSSIEINQGTSIALQNFGRTVHVCWTRFKDNNEEAAIMCAKSLDAGETFENTVEATTFCPYNAPTRAGLFRSNALPMLVANGDDPENVFAFISSRSDGSTTCNIPAKGNKPETPRMSDVRLLDDFDTFGETRHPDGSRNKDGMVRTSRNFARIMMMRQKPNGQWDTPEMVDPAEHTPGGARKNFHQIMPACDAGGGTITCTSFDTRLDRLNNLKTPITSGFIDDAVLHVEKDSEGNVIGGSVLPAGIYGLVPPPENLPPAVNNYPLRRNLNTFAFQIDENGIREYSVDADTWYPAANDTEEIISSPSVRVSQFASRQKPGGEPGEKEQLEFNFGGALLFSKGLDAFMSDYNWVWTLSAIQRQQEDGSLVYVPNHMPPNPVTDLFASRDPVFSAGWTSNKYVRGKVFYTGCHVWDEALQMWLAGDGCASTYTAPETPAGMMIPLIGEDGSEGPPMACSAAQAIGLRPGPLTRNQTVMYAPLRPGIHAEIVSAIKPAEGLLNTFVLNITNGSRSDRTVTLSLPPLPPPPEDGSMMSFDTSGPDTLLSINVDIRRGSSNARTIIDFGNAITDPDLPSSVILTVSDTGSGEILAKVLLNRESLAPLENVQTNDPDAPLNLIDQDGNLIGEFYELILKREIGTNQLLDFENLDFENTADLLDFENLDFENLDFENRLVFLDFENLDFENVFVNNLDLENNLYENLDFENGVVTNLDLENLDFENRLLYLDLENLDLENKVYEFLDFENLDFENLDFENSEILLDFENLDFENLDFENFSTFASDIENLDFENLDLENTTPAEAGAPYSEVTFTLDSAHNAVAGVDIQPVFSEGFAEAMLAEGTTVLMTVRKAYMTPTVTTVSGDLENPFCTAQIVAANQIVLAAVLTDGQIQAAIFDGSVDDPPPTQADVQAFFTEPDSSLIFSYRFINPPEGFNAATNSGLFMPTQVGDSDLCDTETPESEINPVCEFDFQADQTAPVILLNGPAEMTLEAGVDTYFETATAADDFDGDLTGSLSIAGVVDTGTLGTYVVTYNVSDAAGNPADTVTRTVHVTDTLDPTITLLGDDPQTIEAGSGPYDDPSVTVSDIFDSSPLLFVNSQLPPVIFGPPQMDTATVGTYFVLYDSLDASGNNAEQVVRTVNVVDTTPPVITLVGSNPMTLEAGDAFIDPGANIFDIGDPGIAVTTDESAVNTSVIGSYTVYYNSTDASGNPAAEVTRSVVVQDTVPPVIDIDIPPIFTPPLGDAVLEPGETTFEISWPVGAVDLEAGLSISCNVGGTVIGPSSTPDYDPATGTLNAVFSYLFSAGTTDIFCTVTDQGGNSVPSLPFQVLVEDRPIIDPDSLPDQPFTVEANDPFGYVDPIIVPWTPVLATDQVDPNPIEAVCAPANDLMLGVNTISCVATDSAGNMSDAVEFDVTIVDTTAPVIRTFPPDRTVEANHPDGYVWPGVPMAELWPSVDASDEVDVVVSAECTPSSVSDFALNPGPLPTTHTVTCIARDAAGNPQDEFGNPLMPGDPGFPATAAYSFQVTVEDSTAPVIDVGQLPDPAPSSSPLEANGSGGHAPLSPLWVDPIESAANDIFDVTVDVTCLPGPSSTFVLGTTSVACSSTDRANNTNTIAPAFTVHVGDTTAPVVTISVNDTLPAEATGPNGASVSFTATANDIVSGPLATSCSVGGNPVTSPHVFGLGVSALTCVAIDGEGIQGSAMTTITVEDTTPPVVSAAPLTIVTMTASADVLEAELTPSITATDLVDGTGVTIACPLPTVPTTFDVSDSSAEFPEYEIQCTATDSRNNEASVMLPLTIAFAYDITIDFQNGNKRAGSTIPVDWWYTGPLNNDARVDPTIFETVAMWFGPYENNNCTGENFGTGDGFEANFSGNSNFRPSASQQLMQYSWQTPSEEGPFKFVVSPPGTIASGECVNLR